jgi:YggT family protein
MAPSAGGSNPATGAIYSPGQPQVKNSGRASDLAEKTTFKAVARTAAGPSSSLVWFPLRRYEEPSTGKLAMRAVLDIVLIVLDLYVWLLIASAVLSWLIAFNVVNTRNQFVASVAEFLYKITEPVLRPIRNMMPNFGGLDISPIIVILIIMFLQRVITYYIYPNVI